MRTFALILAATTALAALSAATPLAHSADIAQAAAPSLDTDMDEVHAAGRIVVRTPEDPDADAAGIKILVGAQDKLREPTSEPAAATTTAAKGSATQTEPAIAISRSNVNVIVSSSDRNDRISLVVDVIERLIRSSSTRSRLRARASIDGKDKIKNKNSDTVATSDGNKNTGDGNDNDDNDDNNNNDSDGNDRRLTAAILAVVGARSSDVQTVAMVRAVLGCRDQPEMMRKCIVALVSSVQSQSRSRTTRTSPVMRTESETLDSDVESATPTHEYFRRSTAVVNPRGPGFAAKRTTVVNPRGPGFAAKRTTVVGGRGGHRRFYAEADGATSDTIADSDATDDTLATNELLVTPAHRVVFLYPVSDSSPVSVPIGRARYKFGWRYPLRYWNAFGRRLYPARCGFGRAIGDFYYC